MIEKLMTLLVGILLALAGWSLSRTFELSTIQAVHEDKVERIQTTEKAVQALIIGLALVLFLLVGCENGARHSLELTEPTDHTTGDDGGKIKYKIIWGSTKHND